MADNTASHGSTIEDAEKACAEVRVELLRWSLEGPPSNQRASAGALADKLDSALSFFTLTATLPRERESMLQADIDEHRSVTREREPMLQADIAEHRSVKLAAIAEKAKLRQQYASCLSSLVTGLSPVSVMCRVRPVSSFKDASDSTKSALSMDGCEVSVVEERGRIRKFRVDRILDDSSLQDDVFSAAAPWIENVATGGSSCIIAYGATGAGKTHTLLGESCTTPGLAHHALRRLIDGCHGGSEVRVTMVECYCDQLRDLLADHPTGASIHGGPASATSAPTLQCTRRDAQNRMVIDAVSLVASTPAVAEEILSRGYQNRATDGTRCNETSSRSHVVLTIRVTGGKQDVCAGGGCLCLVDLAGSENIQRSGADEGGKLLIEAKAINTSLSALADVVEAIAKQQAFVPFRNTRLTMLLEEPLRESKVLFLVNVSPLLRNAADTSHSLQFASRVQAVDFGAQRMRQDQEERLRSAQQRSRVEKEKVQAELEKTQKERDDLQKALSDLKLKNSGKREEEAEKTRPRQQISQTRAEGTAAPAAMQPSQLRSPSVLRRHPTPKAYPELREGNVKWNDFSLEEVTAPGRGDNMVDGRPPLGDVTNLCDVVTSKLEVMYEFPNDLPSAKAADASQGGDTALRQTSQPLRSALKQNTAWWRSSSRLRGLQTFEIPSTVANAATQKQLRFSEDTPVPQMPPQWYMEWFEAQRRMPSWLDVAEVDAAGLEEVVEVKKGRNGSFGSIARVGVRSPGRGDSSRTECPRWR
jgi:hypothetical protein